MRSRKCSALLAVVAVCLFFPGCGDSIHPLSDPLKSKADARLIGEWRQRDEVFREWQCSRFEAVGDKLPQSVIRVRRVTHGSTGDKLDQDVLAFPTTLGATTYLNVTFGDKMESKLLEENGWSSDANNGFFLFKYKVEGDALLLWQMDGDAKKKAIQGGKIKGDNIGFTDTTENVARFIAAAGDDLFKKKVIRLERVK